MATEIELKKALDFLANGPQMPSEIKSQIDRLLDELSNKSSLSFEKFVEHLSFSFFLLKS